MAERDWEGFIERKIREAMDQGEFDDLPGQGRPLPEDDENPFQEHDRRLAYHLLKSNGFTLPWITRRQEILLRRERLAVPLRRAHELYRARTDFRPDDPQAHAQWRRAQERFRAGVEALNREIQTYNLMVPSDAFRLATLSAEREMTRSLPAEAS